MCLNAATDFYGENGKCVCFLALKLILDAIVVWPIISIGLITV